MSSVFGVFKKPSYSPFLIIYMEITVLHIQRQFDCLEIFVDILNFNYHIFLIKLQNIEFT